MRVAAAAAVLVLCACGTSPRVARVGIEAPGATLTFRAEVADTTALQARGLMGRRALAADAGMLFVWQDAAERRFYMKNTLIPLDLIVIRARRVAGVLTLQPCRVDPCPITITPVADAVLEVNAGTAARAGIVAGARVTSFALR